MKCLCACIFNFSYGLEYFLVPGNGVWQHQEWSSLWHTSVLGCPTAQPLTKLDWLEPLAVESFTFKPRSLGKYQNPRVECAQADFEKLALWDPKILWGFLKWNISAGHMVGPCLLKVSVTGLHILSLWRDRKSL